MKSLLLRLLSFAGLATCLLLDGCTSTVAFRVSPQGQGSSRVACLASSSQACTFEISGAGAAAARHFTLPVGRTKLIEVPADGTQIRGCVANRAFASCSRVTVGRTTATQTSAKGV